MFFNCHPFFIQYTPSYHYRQFSFFLIFFSLFLYIHIIRYIKGTWNARTEFMLAIQWTCWNIIWILFLLLLMMMMMMMLFASTADIHFFPSHSFSNFPHFWLWYNFFFVFACAELHSQVQLISIYLAISNPHLSDCKCDKEKMKKKYFFVHN